MQDDAGMVLPVQFRICRKLPLEQETQILIGNVRVTFPKRENKRFV